MSSHFTSAKLSPFRFGWTIFFTQFVCALFAGIVITLGHYPVKWFLVYYMTIYQPTLSYLTDTKNVVETLLNVLIIMIVYSVVLSLIVSMITSPRKN